MIELPQQQMEALESPGSSPMRLVNPRTHETFILLSTVEYKRLKDDEYDGSPWTKDELQALAWAAGKSAEWDKTWDQYDDLSE